MSVRLGDEAPDFTAGTTHGTVRFHDWKKGSWAILFSHPNGMIHPNASDTFTVRSVFIIGPDNKVKLTLTYPASTGRNFNELLRVLESLQLTANYAVATPADWQHGENVIITTAVSDDDARTRFPKGFEARKPYLRVTPQPNL
jgi:alkyl hydroperoxide reductase subunit AhpC